MEDKVKICFDNEYRIRALDPVKCNRAEDLQNESSNFSESMVILSAIFFIVLSY